MTSAPLLRVRDVAELLDVSRETVLRWTRRGDFVDVAVKLPGGAIRYRPDRLAVWLDGRGIAAPGPEAPTADRAPLEHPTPALAAVIQRVVPTAESAETAPAQKGDHDVC